MGSSVGLFVGSIVGKIVGTAVVGSKVGFILTVGTNVISAVHHELGSEVALHPLAFRNCSFAGWFGLTN